MALRFLEIVVPEEATNDVLKIIEGAQITNFWQTCSCENRSIFKLIVAAEKAETLLDILEKKYSHLEDFHMVLLPLEAWLLEPAWPQWSKHIVIPGIH